MTTKQIKDLTSRGSDLDLTEYIPVETAAGATFKTTLSDVITEAAEAAVVPQTRKINNHALSSDVTLVAADISDVYSKTEIDTQSADYAATVSASLDSGIITTGTSLIIKLNNEAGAQISSANVNMSTYDNTYNSISYNASTKNLRANKINGEIGLISLASLHNQSNTVVNSTATATTDTTTALTNDNVYINHVLDGAVVGSHKIKGTGGSEVITDASGNIIVKTDVNTYGAVVYNEAQSLTDAYKQQARTNIGLGYTQVSSWS